MKDAPRRGVFIFCGFLAIFAAPLVIAGFLAAVAWGICGDIWAGIRGAR